MIDGSVRRIGTTYDDIGRGKLVTSYSDTSGTTIVNAGLLNVTGTLSSSSSLLVNGGILAGGFSVEPAPEL